VADQLRAVTERPKRSALSPVSGGFGTDATLRSARPDVVAAGLSPKANGRRTYWGWTRRRRP
jgi:hypothetical protein